MSGPFRLAEGGLLDRSRELRFSFDGRRYAGFAGDTLASALLASGVRLVGRSFKYHRPRGILGAGPEEPNALVRLRRGARAEPDTRATMVELHDGLEAESQNRWPTLAFDVMALNRLLAPLLPAGFYYKTFMWPADAWQLWEPLIRRAAGLGRAPRTPDPDSYERRHLHCDVVIVGSGPAGLEAARTLARAGARLVLLEERDRFGGALLYEHGEIEGLAARPWLDEAIAELESYASVRLLVRTSAAGIYDHGLVAAVERVADHLPEPPAFQPRQRLWRIRARAVLLATGAIERPIVCGDNDRPGTMLASAARHYLGRYAVAVGRRPVLFTNNDSAYPTAIELAAAGCEVVVVDARAEPGADLVRALRRAGGQCLAGRVVVRTRGGRTVRSVELRATGGGRTGRIACDSLLLAGGWVPAAQLLAQRGSHPVWDEALATFLPGEERDQIRVTGAAAGYWRRAEVVAHARLVAAKIASGLGLPFSRPVAEPRRHADAILPLFAVEGRGKRFVDQQHDVTAEDIALAVREGMGAVEHLKRWTTLGMGTEQGRTANPVAAAILAAESGRPVGELGMAGARPPATPVSLGVLAGEVRGPRQAPRRLTPLDAAHRRLGAVTIDSALWQRPRYYPRTRETLDEAAAREAAAVRASVGITDISTLGKIEVRGPDAAAFLDRLCVGRIADLAPGRVRYSVMLREDGFVLDDGTVTRFADERLFVTTSTAHTEAVLRHLEYHHQVVWPGLRLRLTDVTERWAAIAVAGPRSRELIERAFEVSLGRAVMPFMAAGEQEFGGIMARILRVSFSGELAFELYFPADHGQAAFERLLEVGAPLGVVPYGLEAANTLRVEKGHPAAPEIDGRTTLGDLGLERLVTDKPFVGRPMTDREGLTDPDRPRLVGLISRSGRAIRAGALLFEEDRFAPGLKKLGHVTSPAFSPALATWVALALLRGGLRRKGSVVHASSPLHGEHLAVDVVTPCFVDPGGTRARA